MKSRSSSPAINVYLNEATPVCVRVQKPKLLPSVVELSRVSKRKPSAGSAKWTKSQKGKTNDYHKSKTFEWGQNYKQQRPAQALKTTLSRIETISTLTHSNNANFDKEANIHERMNQCGQQIDRVMEDLKQLKNELNTSTEQFEEDLDGSNESKYMAEDLEAKQSWELSRTNYKHRAFWESFEKLQKKLDLKGLKRKGLAEENKLLIALKEAETTSLAAAKQVATLKNSIAELIQMNQLSTSRINKLAGEKDMLLEKVESSSIANQKLQQLLKDMQNQESSMDCTNMQMEVLMQKLTKSESENIHLRSKLLEAERNAKEASEMCQKEKDNSFFAKQLSKSIGATRAHLQGQLQNKEAESDRMLAQILRFERTIIDQKLQIEHLESQLSTVKEKVKEDKTVLKKASQTQKRRAERFEAAMGNLNSQMKNKEMKLLEAHKTLDTWNKQYSAVAEDKAQLETEIISLSRRVDALKEQLKKTTERAKFTSRELMDKLHTISSENASLQMENAQLKASLATLRERATITAAELQQLRAKAKQQEEVVLQYETQVQFLRTSADELKADLGKAAVGNRQIKNTGDAAKQKASDQRYRAKSPLEKLESLREEKRTLQQALDVLSWKLREVDIQNQELTEMMAKQEEAVLLSNCQLEERSKESAALSQQLEAALHDVSKKVGEVKDQAMARERAFQNRILGLESELNRETKDLKQLQQNKDRADINYKMRQQELKLSLEQSENQNRSIQNYIQFLKASYTTMFGDSVPTELHTEPVFDNVPTTLPSTC